jgi:glyceraldehyde 3-phosphate dehydrogenase
MDEGKKMTIRVAINGYGRIGRMVLRAIYEEKRDIKVVAINGLGGIDINAHLTQYDSAHGRFNAEVSVDGDYLVINGDRIKMYSTRNPLETPWGEHQVDVVLECSGAFTTKEKAMVHIQQGAKKVLISAPGGEDVDATIVYGVNHQVLKATDQVDAMAIDKYTFVRDVYLQKRLSDVWDGNPPDTAGADPAPGSDGQSKP